MGGDWNWHRLRGIVLMVVVGLVVAACGNASSSGKVSASPSATSTVMPNATPTPALIPPALCGTDGGSPVTVTSAGTDGIYASDFMQLPDEWTQTPHPFPRVPTATQYSEVIIGNDVLLLIYPSIGTAAQPGIICGVTVQTKSFQPLSGPVPNVYHWCVDQVYSDPGGVPAITACPAVHAPAGVGNVTLPSSSAGRAATASINGFLSSGTDPNHPAQIPNDVNGQLRPYVALGIAVPAAGTYTFEISLWQTSLGPTITMPDVTATLLFKQALHEWGGEQCTTPDMQALLPPPTNPPTLLICPGPPSK